MESFDLLVGLKHLFVLTLVLISVLAYAALAVCFLFGVATILTLIFIFIHSCISYTVEFIANLFFLLHESVHYLRNRNTLLRMKIEELESVKIQ